jgi:hypothetical protein
VWREIRNKTPSLLTLVGYLVNIAFTGMKTTFRHKLLSEMLASEHPLSVLCN